MKHTLKYFFSTCLIFCFFVASAQEKPTSKGSTDSEGILPAAIVSKPVVKTANAVLDSIPVKTDRYGLRLGLDVFRLTRALYDKDYKGIEIVADYRLTKKYFLAAELGNENKTTDDDRLNFTSKGSYLKVGFDYNAYENWLDMENVISIGLRYGFSTFSQDLNSFKIYNSNPYFGEKPAYPSTQTYSGLSASWIEVVAGIKAKVFNNVFMGFSLRLNQLVTNKKPDNFDNLYIPGFNKTYDGSFGVGFNYTVSYFLPIYKKKIKLAPIAKKEAPKK